MARRHETLIPLTHDHHHALAQARRLADSAAGSDRGARARRADDFVNFYLGRLLHHFREEEELFFAPIVNHDAAHEQVLQALAEHLEVHALAHRLKRQVAAGDADPGTMTALSALVTRHVRFEESVLFPLVESLIAEQELYELAADRRDV